MFVMKMADMVSTSRFDDAYAEKATRQLMNGDPKVFQMAMRIPTSEVQYMQRLLRKNNLSGPLQPHGSACGSETTSGDSGDTDDSGDAISPEEELSMRTQLAHMRRVNKICHGCQSKDNVAEMRRCSRCQLVWYCGCVLSAAMVHSVGAELTSSVQPRVPEIRLDAAAPRVVLQSRRGTGRPTLPSCLDSTAQRQTKRRGEKGAVDDVEAGAGLTPKEADVCVVLRCGVYLCNNNICAAAALLAVISQTKTSVSFL
jgi:hypothetical protein